jgi:hypothetical protein
MLSARVDTAFDVPLDQKSTDRSAHAVQRKGRGGRKDSGEFEPGCVGKQCEDGAGEFWSNKASSTGSRSNRPQTQQANAASKQ